jgi:hypothetical protein
MFRSDLSVSKNHFHVTSDSTSTIAIAIGKMQSLGSMPTAIRSWPPIFGLDEATIQTNYRPTSLKKSPFACIDAHVACAI